MVRSTAGRVARGVTTDSRAVVPGGAFVALRGETHDAHAFVAAAIEAGAVLVVVERGRAPDDARADAVEVDDTWSRGARFARAHLQAWRRANAAARVVAITGSAGKTTTKELCAALLRTMGSGGQPMGDVHATAGNLNNRVGVPAVVLELEPRHRFAVLEVGMSLPGEIAALASIVEPDVAVITNVGMAHAGGVGGSLNDVAREKGALFAGVRAEGVCVANADDAAVLAQLARAPRGARVTSFGRAETAQYRPSSARPSERRAPGSASRAGVVTASTSCSPSRAKRPRSTSPPRSRPPTPLREGPVDPGRAVASLAPIAGRMQVRRSAGIPCSTTRTTRTPARCARRSPRCPSAARVAGSRSSAR